MILAAQLYERFYITCSQVEGVQSIRAQNLQSILIRQLEDKIDFNQKSACSNVIAERWLSHRLELAGTMITFFAALFAVLSRDTLETEIVGWSVSVALQITSTLYLWIRVISEAKRTSWRLRELLVVQDLAVRYQDGTELVLKGISFQARSGEKVGIVGRTGAGKSSLTLSLFRIIEPANGRILVDGIDVSKIGLHSLRSRLTIIPQDPVLFSGTLRVNLDPTDEYSDSKFWEALDQAHLKTFVSTLKFGLQSEVVESGSNFSVGQRHLICLVRAVLKKTKLLIMDEATAAVDVETDNLIQTTIQRAFKDSTVLTIAHRLNTVLDYDRIIVLDKGRIVEFDSPASLLKSEESLFYHMASDAKLI